MCLGTLRTPRVSIGFRINRCLRENLCSPIATFNSLTFSRYSGWLDYVLKSPKISINYPEKSCMRHRLSVTARSEIKNRYKTVCDQLFDGCPNNPSVSINIIQIFELPLDWIAVLKSVTSPLLRRTKRRNRQTQKYRLRFVLFIWMY